MNAETAPEDGEASPADVGVELANVRNQLARTDIEPSPQATSNQRDGPLQHVAPLLLLALAVALAFANAWPGTFQFDDFVAIVDEPRVHGLAAWWASMPGLRPLLKLSYVASWRLGDGAPWAFLAFNLAVHVVNACLVYALAWRLQPRLLPKRQASIAAALLAALLFALHPAQTESVTYLSGRSTSLMATFALSALVAWMGDARRARPVALLLFALAMGVKETAIAWPLAVTLVEALDGGWRAGLRRAWPAWLVAVIAALGVLAMPAYRALVASSLATRSPVANLATSVDGVAYLVWHPLLRLQANIDPDIATDAFTFGWWLRAALIVAALAYALRALRSGSVSTPRARLGAFAILWLAATLAPTQSLAARYDIANDRQLYVALAGLAVAAASAFVLWTRGSLRVLPLVTVAFVVTALGMATHARNRDYASELALWRATVRASPAKSRPWNNLGVAERAAGNATAAREAFTRALAIDPGDIKARSNLMLLDLAK